MLLQKSDSNQITLMHVNTMIVSWRCRDGSTACKVKDLSILLDRSANGLRAEEGCSKSSVRYIICQNPYKIWKKKLPKLSSYLLFLLSIAETRSLVLTFTELPGLVWQVSRTLKWTHTGLHAHAHTRFLSGLSKDLLSAEGQMKV